MVTSGTSGERVPGATVSFSDSLVVVTDRGGEFDVRQVPWGWYQVVVARIGYRSKGVDVAVAGDPSGIFLAASLEPLPVELEPVVIRGDTATVVAYGRMADFFRRPSSGAAARHRDLDQVVRRPDPSRKPYHGDGRPGSGLY